MEKRLRNRNNLGKSYKRILFIALSIVSLTLSSGCILYDTETPRSVYYRVSANASGPSEIFIPMPEYGPLADRLKLDSRKGEFEKVDTIYGRCLRITFDSFVTIKGEITPSKSSDVNMLTANLTTMEPGIIDNRSCYVWCNITSALVNNFSICTYVAADNWQTTYSYDSKTSGDLKIGWYRYQFNYSYGHYWVD